MEQIQKNTNNAKQYYSAFQQGWFSVFRPLNMQVFDLPDFSKGQQRDAEAITRDWRQVGNALRSAMAKMPNGR